jgi:hypothetical protein
MDYVWLIVSGLLGGLLCVSLLIALDKYLDSKR